MHFRKASEEANLPSNISLWFSCTDLVVLGCFGFFCLGIIHLSPMK